MQALANYSHTYSDKDNPLWWPPTRGHIASYLNWKSRGVKVLRFVRQCLFVLPILRYICFANANSQIWDAVPMFYFSPCAYVFVESSRKFGLGTNLCAETVDSILFHFTFIAQPSLHIEPTVLEPVFYSFLLFLCSRKTDCRHRFHWTGLHFSLIVSVV